jgi:hypothetical protein
LFLFSLIVVFGGSDSAVIDDVEERRQF